MNKLKHTPGPWIDGYHGNSNKMNKCIISLETKEIICDILKIDGFEGNTLLISSAPEMRDCLIHCLKTECTTCNVKNSSCVIGKVCNKIKYITRVIEKATGKTIEDIINE